MPIKRTMSPVETSTVSPSTTLVIVRAPVVVVVGGEVVVVGPVVVSLRAWPVLLTVVIAAGDAVVGSAGSELTPDEVPHPTRAMTRELRMNILRTRSMARRYESERAGGFLR